MKRGELEASDRARTTRTACDAAADARRRRVEAIYAGRLAGRAVRRHVAAAGTDGFRDASGAFISSSAFCEACFRMRSKRRRTSVTLLGVNFDV